MKKRILACLLALVMLIGLLPVTALAVDAGGTTVPMLDVSKSKTATALDANGQTQITLSLPSAEETLATDIVLVMDASYCAQKTLQATIKLLDDLQEQQELGANIKLGIVMFKGNAVPFRKLDDTTDLMSLKDVLESLIREDTGYPSETSTAVKEYVKREHPEFMSSGTNIPAGLQLAKNMLDDDTTVPAERKYMVLASDGSTYLFIKDEDYSNAWSRHYEGTVETQRGGLYENNWRGTPIKDAETSKIISATAASKADWEAWLKTIEANYDPKYDYDWENVNTPCPLPIPLGTKNLVINGDVSILQISKLLASMQSTGYNCYYYYSYDSQSSYCRNMLKTFLGNKAIDMANTESENVFSGVTKDIIFLLSSGSTVEDTVGENFDFVAVKELTVGGTALAVTKAATPETGDTATYYFGTSDGSKDGTNYPFVLHYTSDADGETLVWDINVDITIVAPVQLKYTLKLTNPKSEAGTNGVNDLNGDGKEDATGKDYDSKKALYTNENAYLFPMDSTSHYGEQQKFPKPSVAVDENAIPDYLLPILNLKKAAPKLNTRDHFAYVQGYPDGTVKPAGSITRAEVAAILFRLMDADSRSLYYSTASGFRDVDSTKWYNTYVATLNNAGVITDSRTGYFRPNDAITRAELAAMLAQFAEKKSAAIYFSDVSAGYWAANAIALTANLGWINGYPDGTFGPDKTVTRAELMAMVNRATGRAPESADALLPNMKTWKDNADTARWYYLDVQEATNSHTYLGAPTETWTSLTATPDWSQYE